MYIKQLNIDVLGVSQNNKRVYIFDYSKGEPYTLDINVLKRVYKDNDVLDNLSFIDDGTLQFNKYVCDIKLVKKTSFPEKVCMSILLMNNIPFIQEYKLKGLMRRFDFYIPIQYKTFDGVAIEVQGKQHYSYKGDTTMLSYKMYKSAVKSDVIKREYCIENNILLIELDAKKSGVSYICDSIVSNKELYDILYYIPNKQDVSKYIKKF
ncbi:hypothetical protein Koombakaat1_00083 [Staphylococcus phage Koomba-kaat_1]|nr:hypothetical protein Koombakaat1_00083 [Staphylococcus phage Koomba-kaat_1]